jgi:tetratricopeptide (TPR) repeat protein
LQLSVEIHLSVKNSPAAEEDLAALADAGVQPEESLARAASLARLRDDRAAEIRYLRRLWQLQPDNVQLGWRLVEACADVGDLPGRRAILERLAPLDPEARRELQAAVERRPPTNEQPGRLQVAPERPIETPDDGDWQSLAASLRQEAARESDLLQRARLLMRLGKTLEGGLGRPLEALEAYREAAAAADDVEVLEALADAAYRQQDWRQAKQAYDRIWALQPDGPARGETAFRRGIVHENLGSHDIAEQCYSAAIELRPDHRAALEAQARMALQQDDVAGAIETLTALSQLLNADEFENIAELRQRLGELHLRRGDLDMARAYLEAALDLDGRSFKSLQLMLRVHEKAGNHAEAIDVLRQLDFRTEDPMIRASLLHHQALLLSSALEAEDRAVECLLKAYDIAPNHIPTLWRLLDYYWTQNDMRAVVEIGEELKNQGVLTDDVPDRRHARLGAAVLLAKDDMRRAQRLVALALSETELVDLVLLDLAALAQRSQCVESIATLLVAVDESHALRDRAPDVAEGHREAPGLSLLLDEIFERRKP